jgi:hypothetical protein
MEIFENSSLSNKNKSKNFHQSAASWYIFQTIYHWQVFSIEILQIVTLPVITIDIMAPQASFFYKPMVYFECFRFENIYLTFEKI